MELNDQAFVAACRWADPAKEGTFYDLRIFKCPALPLVGPPAGARAGRQVYLEASPRLT